MKDIAINATLKAYRVRVGVRVRQVKKVTDLTAPSLNCRASEVSGGSEDKMKLNMISYET